MKLVILAAGQGTRLRPLTNDTPKPLVRTIRRRTLLDHILEALPPEIDEIIPVVNYRADQIIEHLRDVYVHPDTHRPYKVNYAMQLKADGTYRALEAARQHLDPNEKFMLLYADDVYKARPLAELAQQDDLALVTAPVENPKDFGIVQVSPHGYIFEIQEKPAEPKGNLASTGAMMLSSLVFKFEPQPHPKSGEYVLADAIGRMIQADIRFREVRAQAGEWEPIGYPQDLERLNQRLDRRQPKKWSVLPERRDRRGLIAV